MLIANPVDYLFVEDLEADRKAGRIRRLRHDVDAVPLREVETHVNTPLREGERGREKVGIPFTVLRRVLHFARPCLESIGRFRVQRMEGEPTPSGADGGWRRHNKIWIVVRHCDVPHRQVRHERRRVVDNIDASDPVVVIYVVALNGGWHRHEINIGGLGFLGSLRFF